MGRILALISFVLTATCLVAAATITVNCDDGQSLSHTLTKLSNFPLESPMTVIVRGTCTEYVVIRGFEDLTVKGQGATIVQPSTAPTDGLLLNTITVEDSRSVTLDGFTIHSLSAASDAVGIGGHSSDIRLRNLTIDGTASSGVAIYEGSQASLANVTVRDVGYASVGVWDVSDAHIESCLFENTTGALWHVGIATGSGHVTLRGTTIRNMQVGIDIGQTGIVDLVDFNNYYPKGANTDVVIDNPAGTNYEGVHVAEGSSLNVETVKLRINNAGQLWGFNTGGVVLDGNSTLDDLSGNLVIAGSQGQGIFVANNSHAVLAGSSVSGGGHGGIVAVNQSSVEFSNANPPSQITGNITDLFCDSQSWITGAANASYVNSQCSNLQNTVYVGLP